MNKVSYDEVARVKMSNTRDVVISKCSKGGYTIAQKILIDKDEKPTSIFLKGAIKVNDIDGLKEIKETIDMAIKKLKGSEDESIEWDDE